MYILSSLYYSKDTIMRNYLVLLFLSIGSSFSAQGAKIDTLIIYSNAMNKSINNIVITPDNYSQQNDPYSTLYLLHGAGDDYAIWAHRMSSVTDYADQYNIIIVCPDGASTSWYFDSPIDNKMQYETYVSAEVVAQVDNKYHTKADKSGRAITGLSMGGHGAFYLAFKHPNIWGAAGSMSGGLDIRSFPNNWDIAKRLGPYKENQEVWDNNTVVKMVDLLEDQNTQLIFDCGIDDFFLKVNRNMHSILLEQGVPHDYIERPGGHTKAYWENSLKYQVLFFNDFFNQVSEN